MQHLVMSAIELRRYHFDRHFGIAAPRMLAILVEQGVPEDEARRRINSQPHLRDELAACES